MVTLHTSAGLHRGQRLLLGEFASKLLFNHWLDNGYYLWNCSLIAYLKYNLNTLSPFVLPSDMIVCDAPKGESAHRSGRGRRFDLNYQSKFQQNMVGTCL